jgi:hypothetical protein
LKECRAAAEFRSELGRFGRWLLMGGGELAFVQEAVTVPASDDSVIHVQACDALSALAPEVGLMAAKVTGGVNKIELRHREDFVSCGYTANNSVIVAFNPESGYIEVRDI